MSFRHDEAVLAVSSYVMDRHDARMPKPRNLSGFFDKDFGLLRRER